MAAVIPIVAPEMGALKMLRPIFLMLSARPWKTAAPIGKRISHLFHCISGLWVPLLRLIVMIPATTSTVPMAVWGERVSDRMTAAMIAEKRGVVEDMGVLMETPSLSIPT